MQIVVLAGGLATRMRPETAEIPKSLLLVQGRPFVEELRRRRAMDGGVHQIPRSSSAQRAPTAAAPWVPVT